MSKSSPAFGKSALALCAGLEAVMEKRIHKKVVIFRPLYAVGGQELGFLPGTEQEWDGIIRRGAKLLYAYAEASVPLVTLITRKAYGGAYIVMGSKQLGADINLAWPTAEIAVMGGQGAINILYRNEIKAAEDAGQDVAAVRARLAAEYTYNVASPFLAAERGELDGIIEPAATRIQVIKALRALRTKRSNLPPKKHGNIPL